MAEKLKYPEILANPDNLVCVCAEADCEWHGDCKSCIDLHRYHETVPSCLDFASGKESG